MKRFICLVIVALLSLTLSSCGSQNLPAGSDTQAAASGETAASAESKPQQESEPVETVNADYEVVEDLSPKGAEWARSWIENTYIKYGITDVYIEPHSEGVFDEVSNDFEVHYIVFLSRFSSQKAISGIQKDPDGKYSLKLLCVSAVKYNSKYTSLIGFLEQGQFDEYNTLPAIYGMVSKDQHFSSRLKSLSIPSLPKEFEQIDMRLISQGHNCFCARTLPCGITFILCVDKIGNSEKNNLGVLLFNLDIRQVLKYINIGEYDDCTAGSIIQGKFEFGTYKYSSLSSPDYEIFTVDSEGNVNREENESEKSHLFYSPDGGKYAYSDKNSLYVTNLNDNIPKLILPGIYSEGYDCKSYYPFTWADNSRIIYEVGGYGGSAGCGVFNVTTGDDTFLQQVFYDAPAAYIDSKLFTNAITENNTFDPSIVDMSNPEYPARKIFKDKDFENMNIRSYSISPDGKKIALLEAISNNPKSNGTNYKLYIYSAEDGSALKEWEFQTGDIQYMDYFDINRISLHCTRSAFSDNYLFIVNVDL